MFTSAVIMLMQTNTNAKIEDDDMSVIAPHIHRLPKKLRSKFVTTHSLSLSLFLYIYIYILFSSFFFLCFVLILSLFAIECS